jgi:hypothetical protein
VQPSDNIFESYYARDAYVTTYPGVNLMARRLTIVFASLIVALCLGAPAAFGWANGPAANHDPDLKGYGYGTHDWILDHAIKQAGSAGDWVVDDTALWHTNDPDFKHINANLHLFRQTGWGRGGPSEIARLYYEVTQDLKSNDTTAASVKLGILAHYYGDIVQPFHTTDNARKHGDLHSHYEQDVDSFHRKYADTNHWLDPAEAKDLTDVRARAISAAKFARSKYSSLMNVYKPGTDSHRGGNVHSNSTMNNLTGAILSRAVNDLADLIRSAPSGAGVSAPPTVVSTWMNKSSQHRGRKICANTKCLDANGNALEGVRVDFKFPKAGGGTISKTSYTDPDGKAYYWFTVPNGLSLKTYPVKALAGSAITTSDTARFLVAPHL